MQRYAAVVALRPEHEAEYRRLHADAWPEVLAALTRSHVHNYSIFLHDDMLFQYLEYHGDDYEADMARIAEDETTQRWWTLTDPMQRKLSDDPAAPQWTPLEEVFHLD